jgi:hypothetical protein
MPEPPANGGYMVAAYVVAAVILLGYFGSLVRRARRVRGEKPPPLLTPAGGTPDLR